MIAIHSDRKGFSVAWVRYCKDRGIPHKLVDCHASNIIDDLKGCAGLLWHWSHLDQAAAIHARSLIRSLELSGKLVYPNHNTSWHYDDKIGQKYLLEALGYSDVLVSTHVFYRKQDALRWLARTTYPKVFKLRSGAGSENVILVKSKGQARRFVRRSFGSGWHDRRRLFSLRERIWRFRRDKSLQTFLAIGLGIGRAILPKKCGVQIGYAYFQDFFPDNSFDVRVIVIGNRAFAMLRYVRRGDFRASGSGLVDYDPSGIPIECIKLSFGISTDGMLQSCAYDYIFCNGVPKLVEVSYAFTARAYDDCPGYWTSDLTWHAAPVRPEEFIIEDFLEKIQSR